MGTGETRSKLPIILWSFGAVLLVLTVLSTGGLFYLKHQHDDARIYQRGGNQADTEEWCIEVPFFLEYCRTIEIDSKRKTSRADQDLRAQQEMADWAFGALLISMFGLLASVAGLGFLFWSLRQTQEAISDNKKIGQAEAAAYLSVVGGDFTLGPQSLQGHVCIKNNGATPAEHPRVRMALSVRPTWVGGGPMVPTAPIMEEILPLDSKKRWVQAGSQSRFHFHWFNDQIGEKNLRLFRNSDKFHFVISCHIEWRDVFGNRLWTAADVSNQAEFSFIPEGKRIASGDLHVREFQTE